jgi:soluble lytic murein transglycosylase
MAILKSETKGTDIRRRRPLPAVLAAVLALAVVVVAGMVVLANRPSPRRLLYALTHSSEHFDPVIWETAARHGICPYLVKAVVRQESGFNPLSRGRHGEIGLMQIMDGAALDWARHHNTAPVPRGLLFSPRLNIEIGVWYLARAREQWAHMPLADSLSLAQYNAGRSNVLRWSEGPMEPGSLDWVRFSSTREYIGAILRHRDRFRRKHAHRESPLTTTLRPPEPAPG